MSPVDRGRTISRWALAAAYLLVGIIHLRSPGVFLRIMPGWVPFPRETVLLTGACEIAGAIALMTARFRRLAGIMLAAYAVCVYPANVKHAIDDLTAGAGPGHLGWWYHAPRLAFQPVIVWWALFAGGVVSWPFGKRGAPVPPAPTAPTR